jgi:hypothetical protein
MPQLQAVQAVRALRAAPRTAAFEAVAAARTAVRPLKHLELRRAVMRALGDPVAPRGSMGLRAPSGPGRIETYRWIQEHFLAPAGCINYLSTTDIPSVVRAYGKDPTELRTGTLELTPEPLLAFRQVGAWLVTFAFGDDVNSYEQRSRILTTGRVAVRIEWTSLGDSFAYYATDGDLQTRLSVKDLSRVRMGCDPHALDRYVAELGIVRSVDSMETGAAELLTLAELITGVAFEPEALDLPHDLLRLPLEPPPTASSI